MMLEENSETKDQPKRPRGPLRKRWLIVVLVIGLAGAGTFVYWTKAENGPPKVSQKQGAAVARAIPVVAVPAREGDLKIFLNGLGSVIPLNTVTVRSRVEGQLMEVLFKEGQTVTSGQLLARIDPRPFEVQLMQAEGQMARDQALLNNAKNDQERYRVLWQQNLISKQSLDTQEALVRQYEGTIKTDQGQIENAKLQLTYSRITAPVSGRIGLRLVDPGNIVRANDPTGLMVITQLHPITVVFSLPEDSIPRVMGKLKGGERPLVAVFDREQSKKLATGTLQTVDNQIDSTTGTVRLKALFENKDYQLFPNQFVNASLLVDIIRQAILIPAAAIQQGAKGPFVYTVKADRTVEIRPVTVGEIQNGEAAIKSGLEAGTQVVVDGADRLREGAKVELKGQGSGSRRRNG